MSSSDDRPNRFSHSTNVVRAGRDKSLTGPFVNPPIVRASTVLFPDTDTMLTRRQRYHYGRRGTPTSDALDSAISELEGAAGAVSCPSGLNAATTALLSATSAGDTVLMVDCVYGPVRHFADTVLRRMGVETVYVDPAVGAGIAELITDRVSVVYLEPPGSLTFEMQDVPAIVGAARAADVKTIVDNTWATPLFFKPLEMGADLSVQAGTKYIGGHSDVNLGFVAANDKAWPALKETHGTLGLCVGPDDLYLGMRGLRTLAVRLERQMESGLTVASWLNQRSEVAKVLYPALPDDPGHAVWKRDMKGACGLFSVVMNGWSPNRAKAFVDGLELFGIGASWGGFESLAIVAYPNKVRTAVPWRTDGQLIRFHIGLEDPADLMADIDASFARTADL
ncbi:cystathionine beta-lyase [Bauldia sp.]|uniref:cystathionine beta-lyase n=1 Tax=Bauldia sp. TaxID=2575872 RepID=UPI003BAA88B8